MARAQKPRKRNGRKGAPSVGSGRIATTVTMVSSASRGVKRKADSIGDEEREASRASRARIDGASAPPATRRPKISNKASSAGPENTPRPPKTSQRPAPILAVMGFGSHEMGELGLGPKATEIRRPRLISSLNPDAKTKFHVVQLDCGGMHSLALTVDNKILSWGVNDNGALGRETSWDGGVRDVDADESDDQSEEADDLNPRESSPAEILSGHFPPKTRFVQVAAGDSCSFVVTDTGLVYGWGTFVNSRGDKSFGYTDDETRKIIEIQPVPVLVPGLKDVRQIKCGANHAIALDKRGGVWAWGVDEQKQLGRSERSGFGRHRKDPLVPHRVEACPGGARYIASGPYHSFAVDTRGVVWSWGLNSYGQSGCKELLAEDGGPSILPHPMKASSLHRRRIAAIDGGAHHSVAITVKGEFLVWGRLDAGQLGVKFSYQQLNDPALIRRDENGRPRICLRPTLVPDIGHAAFVSCGTENTIFVNAEGTAFSAGFGPQGQLGLGEIESLDEAKEIIGKAVSGRRLTWAATGGQFSMIAAPVTRPA